jgi:predicted nuclease of predicted toxin-antitoxin system
VRFFLDHDVPVLVADALRRHRHEVVLLTDALPADATDEAVWLQAQAHRAIMITCNRNDFLRLAAAGEHDGLIILIRRRQPQTEWTKLLQLIAAAGEQGIRGNVNFA